ncbi:MAG: hypothetical protein WGN25_12710 [Candidatus Electrothrix sp. GW3-4]|uniref:hypothetical protein n=1 Tax=Candidatus Electrothrix sp. GW3-4 TaxID=3126740 RepID=UPI0030D1E2E2
MHALKLALTASALVMLLAFPVSSLSAEPQGELYWKVDGDTSDFYSLYNEDDPPTPYYGEYTYGAFDALDHACEQSTINGTYIDDKVRVIILISTEVTGYCRVMTGGLFSYETDGSYYTAHLYCNGEQRSEGDTSPCPVPLIDANNLGLPCEE